MKRIRYFAFYSNKDIGQDRKYVLAATNKIDYICEALNRIGYEVEIISGSHTTNCEKYFRGLKKQLSDHVFLKLFFTFPWGNVLQKALSIISMNGFLFFELLKLKRHEPVIVYHSLRYIRLVKIAHAIKKFKLILEVEEIYSDVSGDEKHRRRELLYFEKADGYIFPTQLLKDSIGTGNKPIVYIHGTYKVEPIIVEKKKLHNIIHCVYAGTFDSRKGGAAAAAAAAAFLPKGYHIHILGFGSDADTKRIKNVISVTKDKSEADVSYDGLLSGNEYTIFIQSCDIGLSTQEPDAAFNNTSFPSKILSYLANGLHVVSINIPAVEKSAIGDMITYYEEQTPEAIAKAIRSVNIDDEFDSRKRINELASKFESDLKQIIEE